MGPTPLRELGPAGAGELQCREREGSLQGLQVHSGVHPQVQAEAQPGRAGRLLLQPAGGKRQEEYPPLSGKGVDGVSAGAVRGCLPPGRHHQGHRADPEEEPHRREPAPAGNSPLNYYHCSAQ